MELIAQFGLFSGILVLLLILAFSFRRSANKIFLGLSLFFVWYTLLLIWLNASGQVLKYPALLRTGLVSAYLAFPFLFIYSRNTFYPGKMWEKTDWILLLPALICIIDFIPFYLLSAEQKEAIWRENIANNKMMLLASEGWLGLSGFHFPFIYIWVATIMYFQIRLIVRNWNLDSGFKSPHNRRLLYFIMTITFLYLPLFLPGIFGVIFQLSWYNLRFLVFSYGVSLSAISIFLLITPKILYGFLPEMKFSYPPNVNSNKTEIRKEKEVFKSKEVELIESSPNRTSDVHRSAEQASVMNEEITPELAIVLQLMSQEKPFRKRGYTIQDLSNQTRIPVYQLSPLINGYFKINFVNWINRYRIDYFIEQAVENQHMTLEALSKDAGFVSRSTFISAFKKEKGITPREYLKDQKLTA